ncbi:sigma factor [Phyllobacterium myrsinacearum]|uniref:DNA-directed RNA polymerase specialized sigma24 family protein n=1 Tax=Phyllobacterium myrsinacearum TaxID=28101 RepID=A0A839EZ82_9HYPH|nr:sigma factor [Phyllobacterium myrsinacearum]MBA8881770.1 DNA-directed RNA polymerase specialized sigma24 family protein [Phyllobacterium myrsinacearum]
MIDWKESERNVNSFADRVMRRLERAGAPLHLREDIRQELWIAWCKARDSWNPQKQAAFPTFLYNGMKMHINRWAEKHVSRRFAEVVAKSIDTPMTEDGAKLEEIIPSADPMPGSEFEENNYWEYAIARLKPRAKLFIQLLRDPPAELLKEVDALDARAEFGRSRGHTTFTMGGVTTTLIFDLMGAPRSERVKIAAQIREAGEEAKRNAHKRVRAI